MTWNKPVFAFFIIILSVIKVDIAFAQAPNISYQTPKIYTINQTISPLIPVNTGGVVPSQAYGQVTTIAGNGSVGAANGPALNASFNYPESLAVDDFGNIFIGDTNNNLIRKISNGMVTTFAGTISPGFLNGTGTNAAFSLIGGVTVGASNNIYVSDCRNNAIRKITQQGEVTTFAGTGAQGLNNGLSAAATFYNPTGITEDSAGNFYISDDGNNVIRKIDPLGNVTTFAGSGSLGSADGNGLSASFSLPALLTTDGARNLYIGDAFDNLVREVTPGGKVTTFAGSGVNGAVNGVGIHASFNRPDGVVADMLGNIYVADTENNMIRKIAPDGTVITIAGSGQQGAADGIGEQATFYLPNGIALDKRGNLFITDEFNQLIRTIAVTGWTIDKPLPAGLIFDPTTGIISGTPTALSPATDYTVTAYNANGSSSTIVNITVTANNPTLLPPNISYATPKVYPVNNPIANLVPVNRGGAVPPANYRQVTTFAGSGVTGYADGIGRGATFSAPIAMAMDGAGNIFVADYNNNTIRKITAGGVVTTLAGKAGLHGSTDGTGAAARFAEPDGVAVDKLGNVFVADAYNNLIRKVSPGGQVGTFAGTNGVSGAQDGLGTAATFNSPAGLAFDNLGNLYVADHNNNMIRKIDPLGNVTIFAGSTQSGSNDGTGGSARFNGPQSIAVDASGNIYVADTGNNLIREITPGGVVTTLAGSGSVGSADGRGTAASFNQPYGIAVDANGVVYVADEKNNLVRQILPGGIVSTVAGNGLGTSVDGIGKTATFGYPGSIVADDKGNIYVGDLSTFFIRKIGLTGYTIDKTLPAGLSFDDTTGIISGTPTAPSPATDYTVTAYNVSGSSSAIVNIMISGNVVLPQPPNISYQTPQTYNVGTAISPLAPTNSGGPVPAKIYGLVNTIAGNGSIGTVNGLGTAASLGGPVATVFDKSGNLFVSEFINNDIRMISPSGMVSTFAGTGAIGVTNGPGNKASFNAPYQMAMDASGNLYVADEGNQVIRMITSAGVVSAYAGFGNQGNSNGTLATADFNNPVGLAIDGAGTMYVADRGSSTIRKIDQSGQVTDFAILDGGSAPNSKPAGLYYLAVSPSGNLEIVNTNQVETSTPAAAINVVAGSGNTGFANGTGTSAVFNTLVGIAVNAAGDIFVGDARNNMVRRINQSGVVTILAGSGAKGGNDGVGSSASFFLPYGVTVDPTNNYLYVADYGSNVVRKVTITGFAIDKSLPTGLTFDATTGTISGTPSFTSPPVTYTITAYNEGGSSSTAISIQIINPTITFDAIPTIPVCTADFDPGATGAGPVSYNSGNTAVATIVGGKIHITGPGISVISATDGSSTKTQILTVTPAVTPTIDISPTAADDCQGATVTFSAAITNGGTSPTYQWQLNGANTGGNSDQLVAGNLNDGYKITCILTSNAACTTSATATSNTAIFTVDPPITTSIAISSTATGPICAGTEVTFTAIANTSDANPTYQWQVNGINAGTNAPTFTTTTFVDGSIVTCILTSAGKCILNPQVTSNAITLSLNPQSQCIVTIPNAFTPNGDGINDLWDITALQSYPGCTIAIYNRYGSLIYNSINYPKAWDGTYNGKRLPVGTYYYIINLNNGKKPLAGFVTILR